MVSPMAFPNALENRISCSVASLYFSSSVISFSARFLFHLSGLSSRLPCLSLSLPSLSVSPGSGVPPCILVHCAGW